MLRIISDAYVKENKRIWGTDPTTEFNQKILAVNNMYGWLYNQGLLEKVCFEFKDYSDGVEFALDVKDLEPYRSEMEACDIDGAALAVRHIFDEPYTPCTYSGAIELGWTMQGYRSVDGMVGRSWECGLSQDLNTEGIYAVAKVREEQGVKAAVKEMFAQLDWELTLPEQKVYDEALKYFGKDVATNIENDFVKDHARELIFCYDNGKTLIDFDFWTQYETLLAEKITYEEYRAIDGDYEDDPLDIDPSDRKTIVELKRILDNYRSKIESSPKNKETKSSIDSQIHSASTRTAASQPVSQVKAKEPDQGL